MKIYYYNKCDGKVYDENEIKRSKYPIDAFESLGKCKSRAEAEEKADARF